MHSTSSSPGATTWQDYWRRHGQPWRTEQEASPERQRFLLARCAIAPDIEQHSYPFKDIELSRSDVEWLLATHDEGRGPVDWRSSEQRISDGHNLLGRPLRAGEDDGSWRQGLDLRGADLRGADLSHLPLSRSQFGLTYEQYVSATQEQMSGAAARLERAVLREAHMEASAFWGASLAGADLKRAHLEAAGMGMVCLDGADARAVHLEAADLRWASLQGVDMRESRAERIDLRDADLTGAKLDAAHMEGANLRRSTLQAADFSNVHLEGGILDDGIYQRIRLWTKHISHDLPAGDLREVYVDADTRLDGVILGNLMSGFVRVADLHWRDGNLAVIDWTTVPRLGDELLARERYRGSAGDPATGEPERTRRNRRSRKDKYTQFLEYQAAVRAYRQLATALQEQGLNEESARYAYRALHLQQTVFRLQIGLPRLGHRKITLLQRAHSLAAYSFSAFLDALAGYGYRPARTLFWYVLTIALFAAAYFLLGLPDGHRFSPDGALVFSVTSFHGRGFFPESLSLENWITRLAACEAIVGRFVEISFIATFTQRYFGKGSGA